MMELKKEVTEHQPMDMMPTINLMSQDMFKRAPVSSGPTTMLTPPQPPKVLNKKRLHELVEEVDPTQLVDEDVEEVLLQIADDFIESVVTASCQLAKHRKSNTLEAKDVQLHLERNWNMWIPGFGTEEQIHKKSCATEAEKQRLAMIKKTKK
ncbi:transcription initiation factor TFIID subunit 12-like [Dysidea avara]|uniref:transcription initiation factor TFIID subunit 12-like n=1 Tax=Dysidea avara TaxID=196820 RepID=UPI00331C07D7